MVTRRNYNMRQGMTRRRPYRRRRTNLRARIRYQPRNPRTNRSQIRSVARMAIRNSRILNSQRTYCDWVMYSTENTGMPGQVRIPLMTPSAIGGGGSIANQWTATMRQNIDVVTQQRTNIHKFQFNYLLDTSSVVNEVYTSMFLVTVRPMFADWNGVDLIQNQQWASQGPSQMVKLNPGCFKVHFAKFFITYPANSETNAVTPDGDPIVAPIGDPNDRIRRGSINLRMRRSLRAPINQTWKDLTIEKMTPSARLYCLLFYNSDNPGGTQVKFQWGVSITTINSD